MTLASASPGNKVLVLGTALWGWGVDREAAFAMLDRYADLGGTFVDTAANYPINKCEQDFGLAGRWLADWIRERGSQGIKVIMKIGAIDNMGGAEVDLTAAAMQKSLQSNRGVYGEALASLAVHWDNRGDRPEEEGALRETLSLMRSFHSQGLDIGFSGVKRPDLYRQLAPDLADKWWIQVKENAQTRAARAAYIAHFPTARYFAYGINMGGLKSAPADANSSMALRGIVRPSALAERLNAFLQSNHGLVPAPSNFNELAMLTSYANPGLSGIIIGPRTAEQLQGSLSYWAALQQQFPRHQAAVVYERLLALAS